MKCALLIQLLESCRNCERQHSQWSPLLEISRQPKQIAKRHIVHRQEEPECCPVPSKSTLFPGINCSELGFQTWHRSWWRTSITTNKRQIHFFAMKSWPRHFFELESNIIDVFGPCQWQASFIWSWLLNTNGDRNGTHQWFLSYMPSFPPAPCLWTMQCYRTLC
jgi:hypothetical protein